MVYHNFYGGIHPSGFKTLTSDRPTKRVFIPKRVVLPLSQHVGFPAEPIVAAGDVVTVGRPIAKPGGYISSYVHATISGKVKRIGYSPTPTHPRTLSIMIESEADEDQDFKEKPVRDVEAISHEALLDIVKDAGIVGLGGAAFPAHVKLAPPKTKPIDSVILNGAECEPYLTCDHRLMLEKPREILKGLELIVKILGAKEAYIAIEDNKLSAIYAMERAVTGAEAQAQRAKGRESGARVKVIALKTKYPQGAEKQVIKSVLGRVVPAGGLPMDVGCVVHNVGTVFSIYEAVYLSKPLIERVVTITGSCVREPVNLRVRIGTLLSDLKPAFGGFTKEPKAAIVGGTMMGVAQYTLDVPIIKGTSGVVFLSEEEIDRSEESVCIRCGRCIETCPMGLIPTTLMNRVKKDLFSEAKEMGILNCYECGACAYVCPAKIPILDYMKFGKSKIVSV